MDGKWGFQEFTRRRRNKTETRHKLKDKVSQICDLVK